MYKKTKVKASVSISLVLMLGLFSAGILTKDQKQDITIKTYVYRVVGDCAIKADVYGGKPGGGPRPVAIWIHGGALIMGSRQWIPKPSMERLLRNGFVIVSIDYRLAPETKLPYIIEDVQSAYKWVREKGPELFGADPNRIGVFGTSAGGYLTLMAGFCVQPRPKALISFFGYGDIIGDWYSRPDPFYSKEPPVSKEKAYSVVGDKVISEAPTGNRAPFYLYCRQQGLWPKEVVGYDPHKQPQAFEPYCAIQNVSREYPPMLLIHGDKDTDVPHQQSVKMAAELARFGVTHELIMLRGVGHNFVNAKPDDIARTLDKVITFFKQYVESIPEVEDAKKRLAGLTSQNNSIKTGRFSWQGMKSILSRLEV